MNWCTRAEAEIETIARMQYQETSKRTDLWTVSPSSARAWANQIKPEIKHQLTVQLRDIVDRELLSHYGMMRKPSWLSLSRWLLSAKSSMPHSGIGNSVEASLYVRQTIESTLLQLQKQFSKTATGFQHRSVKTDCDAQQAIEFLRHS